MWTDFQYFGSATGLIMVYPAVDPEDAFDERQSLNGYDPRVRPWYRHTREAFLSTSK